MVFLTKQIDVHKDCPHLDAEHRRVIDERLEAVVVHPDIVDSLIINIFILFFNDWYSVRYIKTSNGSCCAVLIKVFRVRIPEVEKRH